ncbi:DnaB-like helicase C-terminal domain-containing protein, partial [Klebsiella pneumoniae]|nr:DnaB-like helicase C-terminal domain-containing protein [Klebsiella pneumoniae]
ELRCPVIALAQLNRNLEQRANKRPVAADLRESGVIEQEADVIFMVYRDEKYNENTELKGITEIICVKSRHAP